MNTRQKKKQFDLGAVRGFQLLEAQERRRKHVGQVYAWNQGKI